MFINPTTRDYYRPEMAENIERVRSLIRKLPEGIRAFIDKGEEVIDNQFRFIEKENSDGRQQVIEVDGLNVFNLKEDVPGDVMKYLAMLYRAGGWEEVAIECDLFSSEGESRAEQVKFPNSITLHATR